MSIIPKASILSDASAPKAAAESTALATADKSAWITCFGFPPGQAEVVLMYLQSVKRLEKLDYYPKNESNNNWVHVKLKSSKDAALALGENGQVIDFNGVRVMLGVSLFPEGDQLDALARDGRKDLGATLAKANNVASGGGPKRATTLWEKASAWILDM